MVCLALSGRTVTLLVLSCRGSFHVEFCCFDACSSIYLSVLFSIVITSLGEERADLYDSAFVCLFCMRYFLSVFSSSWSQCLLRHLIVALHGLFV